MGSPRLAVMAANRVGFQVMEFLADTGTEISVVVLHREDPGNYNEAIRLLCKNAPKIRAVTEIEHMEDADLVEQLKSARPQLGILAWWPKILKGSIISIPERGWLNFHPSFLPYNRGKHPNFWCLVDETPCGVTLHYVNDGVDSGEIVAQRQFKVSWEDTGETVHRKSCEHIVDLFKERFDDILSGTSPHLPQAEGEGTFHLAKEIDAASKIDLDRTYTARRLFNLIRARTFAPNPTAFFVDNGIKYAVTIQISERS